jgi:hypothetical protein
MTTAASSWPICFVASALGKRDVDHIYDKGICPVLRQLRIRPMRVDRIEHNDDIDDKILALIQSSELCIADLTFARPSVYYEAGVVHGLGRPVVYTTRSDHIRDKDSDPHGILRVHFDLQMKNVISWTGPNATFRSRLRKRLKQVIRPILRARRDADALAEQRDAFKALPVAHQLAQIRRMSIQMFRSRGFRSQKRVHREIATVAETALRSMKRTAARFEDTIELYAFDRLTSSHLKEWWRWSVLGRSTDHPEKSHYIIYVAISLRRVSESTFRSALPLFTPVRPYVLTRTETSGLADDVRHTVYFSLIQNVQSVEELRQQLRDLLQWFDKQKSTGRRQNR